MPLTNANSFSRISPPFAYYLLFAFFVWLSRYFRGGKTLTYMIHKNRFNRKSTLKKEENYFGITTGKSLWKITSTSIP